MITSISAHVDTTGRSARSPTQRQSRFPAAHLYASITITVWCISRTWCCVESKKCGERISVAIFGLGAVGLVVAKGARICSAAKIIGVDKNRHKFELGKKFGVTDFVNPDECGNKALSQVIQDMTSGGADLCFECVGLESLVQEAFKCSRNIRYKVVVGVAKGL